MHVGRQSSEHGSGVAEVIEVAEDMKQHIPQFLADLIPGTDASTITLDPPSQ